MFISTRSSAKLLVNGVVSVVIMTVVFALVLAYGPAVFAFVVDAIRGTWDGVVALAIGLL